MLQNILLRASRIVAFGETYFHRFFERDSSFDEYVYDDPERK